MSDNEASLDNQSLLNQAQCQELRQKITLTSNALIQLTHHQEKFMEKLQQLNRIAIQYIQEEKFAQGGVYLNESQKILQYAAGCGKTIERSLITTILNNQACMLQRISQFEQSANYLQAIIFNITEYLQNCPAFEYTNQYLNNNGIEYAQLATYFERKMTLSLYHLRYCALTSHAKNNQMALKSAKSAMKYLSQLCQQEYQFQTFILKQKKQQNSNQIYAQKWVKLLKYLSKIKDLSLFQENTQTVLNIALQSMKQYLIRLQDKQVSDDIQNIFENYSIGNLMQAGLLSLNSKPNHKQFIDKQYSISGKLYRLVHTSMAYFTVATQMRLISANKYSLDDNQRRRSSQYKLSKVYHLASIILISKYLPCKSIFFDHAVHSFKNHYQINLLEEVHIHQADCPDQELSIIELSPVRPNKEDQVSPMRSRNQHSRTTELRESKQSKQLHESKQLYESKQLNQIISLNSFGSGSDQSNKQVPLTTQSAKNMDVRLIKSHSKNKNKLKISKISKLHTEYSSKAIQSQRKITLVKSKNKQNSSRQKLVSSKGKEVLSSRNKLIKSNHQDGKQVKNVYYGDTGKSRSKSKRDIQLRSSKKNLSKAKSGLVFQTNKLKNQTNVQQQYGVRTAGQFGNRPRDSKLQPKKHKNMLATQLKLQVHTKNNCSPNNDLLKIKKLKSPRAKGQKRKTLSKDKYFV